MMRALTPSDPRRIDDIELHGLLGEGGMGVVYFGVTPDGEQVAVKIVRSEHAGREGVRERFDREIRAMRMVQGPRVASLVAAADPEAEPQWLAMEYIRGLTLSAYVKERGPLAVEMGAVLGDLLAEGLAAIHQAGLLHRDLKPANIILAADGPKIVDFGLVALADGEVELTKVGETIGTPAFMAPEQADSAKDLTQAADVYALGACLLFAVAGHGPYKPRQNLAMLRAVIDPAVAPDLSGLPPGLEPLISSTLDRDPELRPALDRMSEELRTFFTETGLAPPEARIRFATVTYVPQPTDPPTDITPPPPRRPPRPRNVRPPAPAVERLAERLKSAYARGEPL